MTALSPPLSPMHKEEKTEETDTIRFTTRKENTKITEFCFVQKSDKTNIKEGSDWLHENKGTPPHPSKIQKQH